MAQPKTKKISKSDPETVEITKCTECSKIFALCLCDTIRPLKNEIKVVILQHPQEPDQHLGTAKLTALALKNSLLRTGLSWPNLSSALGVPKGKLVVPAINPKDWVVLHLGSGIKPKAPTEPGLYFLDKKGAVIDKPAHVRGIIILDGTWSQGKTLWWRNAWLLKTQRAVLCPKGPSLYQELRKEPRKECLSTIETIAETLSFLGEDIKVEKSLKGLFKDLLGRYRENGKKLKEKSRLSKETQREAAKGPTADLV